MKPVQPTDHAVSVLLVNRLTLAQESVVRLQKLAITDALLSLAQPVAAQVFVRHVNQILVQALQVFHVDEIKPVHLTDLVENVRLVKPN